ncbi:MAG: hypothetical protein M1827_000285 [Pycnora praestabilis]|nr:MAG: hypothetical protein M1827_000285 [Pycnora praestabilis]
MIRAVLLRSVGSVTKAAAWRQSVFVQKPASSSFIRSSQFAPATSFQAIRCYSAPAGLAKQEVEGRIMDLLKNFDKVNDTSKLSNTSHFSNDLGLDSLDTVEVVMAIEEVCNKHQKLKNGTHIFKQEFSIEIPDKEADAIHSSESNDLKRRDVFADALV